MKNSENIIEELKQDNHNWDNIAVDVMENEDFVEVLKLTDAGMTHTAMAMLQDILDQCWHGELKHHERLGSLYCDKYHK